VSWDENLRLGPGRLGPTRRKGECSFSIDFYWDGWALARSYRYLNEDTYQIYSDRFERERIRGGPSTFHFGSRLSISPKENGSYDISWMHPTLDSTEEKYSRLDYRGAEWQPQPSRGSPAYNAHCTVGAPGRWAIDGRGS
jgi:hypothetical protein